MSTPDTTTTTPKTLPEIEAEKTQLLADHKTVCDAMNEAQTKFKNLEFEKVSIEGQLFLVSRLEKALNPKSPEVSTPTTTVTSTEPVAATPAS